MRTASFGDPAGVRVSGPYPLAVTTGAERTEGRALQMGANSQTFFFDLVVVQEGSVLLAVAFLHEGSMVADDLQTIGAGPVERLRRLV